MSKVISKKELKRQKIHNPARTKDIIFCLSILILPTINWIIFSMGQYISMFRLAFTPNVEGTPWYTNFVDVYDVFIKQENMHIALRNSAIFYGLGWVTMLPSLFTSYYINCRFPGTKYFQTMLMLPGIVAGMVWVMVYKYFVDLVLPDILNWPNGMGLLTNGDTKFLSLIIYSLWFALGGGLLIYTGMMGSVSGEIREAGRLDGMNRVREFFVLMIPAVYQIWAIGVVGGVIGFFTSTGSAFEFFGLDAPTSTITIGYVLFQKVMGGGGGQNYGFNCAASMMFTLIVAPIALTLKHFLFKYGPSED